MKVRRLDAPKKEPSSKYPYLGKYKDNDLIVLFDRHGHGMVMNANEHWQVGYYSDVWYEDSFTPYNGEICLSNDN